MDEAHDSRKLPRNPARVLAFIRAFYRLRGRPPADGEVENGLVITAKLTNYYLLFLERGGYIHRQRGLVRGIALTALGVSVRIPEETAGTQRPAAGEAPGGKVLVQLEKVFQHGSDELCDICGRQEKGGEDRFCAACREWLAAFVRSKPKGSAASVALDMARCLAMMLRYGERPEQPE